MFEMKPLYTVKTESEESENNMILLPVGGTFDIPNGRWVDGMRGEKLLIGGLAPTNGMAGKGNTSKTTIMRGNTITAAARIGEAGILPYIETLDTEDTHNKDHINHLCSRHLVFKNFNVFLGGMWKVVDYASEPHEVWFDKLMTWMRDVKRGKDRKKYTSKTPIKGLDGKPMEIITPTFVEIDSLSDFKTSDILKMMKDNEIGESAANTIHARLGLHKLRVLMEICPMANASNTYVSMAAQIGAKLEMGGGGPGARPTKEMQYMRMNEKIKGVPDKFNFLPTIVYQTDGSSLMEDAKKCMLYPKVSSDHEEGSKDLNLVKAKCLRNKTGPTGHILELVVSQSDGFLPDATEFNHCKDYRGHLANGSDGYGLNKVGHGHSLMIYPSVNFTRNTLREKLAEDPRLVRAINITSEILQMQGFSRGLIGFPSMQDLYEKLEAEYGWDNLLDTRGYWTLNQYEHPVPYLSSLDLLRMYHGEYVPYWWKDKEKNNKAKAEKEAKLKEWAEPKAV